MTLGELGPVSLKELAGCLVAESGHPSRLVSRLVDLGYATRSASSDDGRAVILTLTEEGRLSLRRQRTCGHRCLRR
ncbi:winged helix DNA-binding protein [Cutibacterium avidum]|nr:winged helix DNA-binding protein [Cutibacterium avidum]PGX66440.1 hypothetical protein B6N42_04230 [Cutibacterium avidum]